jgi:GH15 family glucan-1,4-alpha-glucosidase
VLGGVRPPGQDRRPRPRQSRAGGHWHSRAETIRTRIVEQSWNEKRQSFVESFGGSELDASVLLMAEVGFLPPADPRFRSTVLALEEALCDGPYMRRYEAADDFGRPESSFNVCSFWRVDALAGSASRIGRASCSRRCWRGATTSACCPRT